MEPEQKNPNGKESMPAKDLKKKDEKKEEDLVIFSNQFSVDFLICVSFPTESCSIEELIRCFSKILLLWMF